MDRSDGIFLTASVACLALCLLLHGAMLRRLADAQDDLHNDVEFLKSYLKETAAHD